jgi:hypothetical protein
MRRWLSRRWFVNGLVLLIGYWIFSDLWFLLRREVRDAFWWMFP